MASMVIVIGQWCGRRSHLALCCRDLSDAFIDPSLIASSDRPGQCSGLIPWRYPCPPFASYSF
jgi:hypothetical protein